MALTDSFTKTNVATPTGSLAESFPAFAALPQPAPRAVQEANIKDNQVQAETEAVTENSPKGLLKNTLADLGPRLVGIPVSFAQSLWQTYQDTPDKFAEDIKGGADTMSAGMANPDALAGGGQVLKGVAQAGGRTAGDAAIAIFAPISAAIGSVLNATGGQQLTDAAGKVIADSSGITDLPAFQKFAMEHPNAGEDFNRILTLFMAKGEQGKIDPVQTTKDATTFAKKLIGQANKPEAPDPMRPAFNASAIPNPNKNLGTLLNATERKVPVFGDTTPRPLPVAGESVETPIPNQNDYRQTQPDIQVGAKGKEALPSIQTEAEPGQASAPAGTKLVPISDGESLADTFQKIAAQRQQREAVTPTPEAKAATEPVSPAVRSPGSSDTPVRPDAKGTEVQAPGTRTTAPKPVENGGGEKVTSKLGESVESKAIEAKLTEGIDDLPEHEQANMKVQNKRASQIAVNDYERAKRIAFNKEEPPADTLRQSVFNAVEEKAHRDKDYETIDRLAKSTGALTRSAQEVRAAGERVPTSPVKLIKEVQTAREANAQKAGGKKSTQTKEQVVSEIKKAGREPIPKKTFEDFVNSIKCGY